MRVPKLSVFFLVPGLLALAATAPDAPAPASALPKVETATFEKDITPLVEKYCYECHGDGMHKADIALDKFKSSADVAGDAKTWDLVLDKIHRHEMPPEDASAQPSLEERDFLVDWIDRKIHNYDPNNPDPGRVTLHRLNRSEYANTIRDLTGVDFHADEDFPPDDSGYGFDNNGDVLSLPPMLMEKYLNAATKILDQAVPTEQLVPVKKTFPSYMLALGFNDFGVSEGGWARLISLEEGHVSLDQYIPAPGEYKVSFVAYGSPDGGNSPNGVGSKTLDLPPETPLMSLRVGDIYIHQFKIDANDKDKPGEYTWEVSLMPGPQTVHSVMDRVRGGENENILTNGRVGRQQNGQVWVKSMTIEGPLPGVITRMPAGKLPTTGPNEITHADERFLTGNGAVSMKFTAPVEGEYILRATAYAQQAGTEPTKMTFSVNGQKLTTIDVLAPATRMQLPGERVFSGHPSALGMQKAVAQVYEFRAKLPAGEKTFSAAFVNEFSDPDNTNPNLQRRTLTIQNLEVVDLTQPFVQPKMTETLKPYFAASVTPANKIARAREILTQFAHRAWRGPVSTAEIDKLMGLYSLADKNGEQFPTSVKLALSAVLVSPRFLFRGEAADAAALTAPAAPATGPQVIKSALSKTAPAADSTSKIGVPVDELTLASRLSYFLWSSAPDDELLNLAEHNQLRAHLADQVGRLLASPKSHAMVDNFAGQWLQFRSLPTFSPDKKVLQDYYNSWPTLSEEMETETGMFFEYIMRQDRSVMDFLTADYTFVNDDLANYYSLPDVTGTEFRRVSIKDTPRRGVLTQGSTLLLTSNPTRTSPVKRGKWVLENLLGTPPPPPPPNVPALDDEKQLTGSLRQQMEQHRANPICASCHARMDPIGFGLENFDAAGWWRDKDGNTDIDASGQLLTGETFNGAAQLTQLLADKKKTDFLRCLSEKMLTFALGRGLEYYDRAATDQMIVQLEKNGDKFSALILGVVNSVPFQQMRRTDALPIPPAGTPPAKVAVAP